MNLSVVILLVISGWALLSIVVAVVVATMVKPGHDESDGLLVPCSDWAPSNTRVTDRA
jgi:hypothetical protein